MSYDFDYFVIGAGSGGVRSARIAAGHGAKVGIAENSALGGTCVNIGCVPKKIFAYASDFSPAFEDAPGYGWNLSEPSFDWSVLRDNKNKEIERLNGIYAGILKKAGVQLFNGFASFVDDHTIDIDGQKVTAKHILIATGGQPVRPDFDGAEHAIVSDDAFYLDKLPKHILIQGGGYVSVEFAHIFHGLGVKVSLIYRGPIFLKDFDRDIGQFLADEMKKQGIDLYFGCDIESARQKDDGYLVRCTNGCEIDCDMIFSAIGRRPRIEGLNLDKAGIEVNQKGRIPVGKNYQTNIPHIYAVGDVTNQYQLTPIAIKEGQCLADILFSGRDAASCAVDYTYVPTAIFSSPAIGTVGISEEEATEKGLDITIYKTDFRPMRYTLPDRDERCMMKLIVDKKTDKVIGLHMVGLDTPEMLQGFAVAMNAGATFADFKRTIPIHPTSAEELVTMG